MRASNTILSAKQYTSYYFVLALFTICYSFSHSQAQIITTYAGNGTLGYSGDGGIATFAQLRYPWAVAVDTQGIIYAGHSGGAVRKIDGAGIITTFAGNGTNGFSGDGGPATAALVNGCKSIAIDKKNNVYFFDYNNARIRKVDAGGIITTFAGSGIGLSGDGGPATAAGIGNGFGLCIDDTGNIYIAAAARIRKVDTFGIIRTFAGTGVPGYSGDGSKVDTAKVYGHGVITFHRGCLYMIDGHSVRKIDAAGIITTFAGRDTGGFTGDNGPASAAQLWSPYGLCADDCDNIYISDAGNTRIRMVDAAGIIKTVAGTGTVGYGGDAGPATAATFQVTETICIDRQSNLYVADPYNYVVRRITPRPPSSTTITGTDTVCPGATITLSAAATAGNWYSSNTATAVAIPAGTGASGVVSGIAGGLVDVMYIGSLSCAPDTVKYQVWVKSVAECYVKAPCPGCFVPRNDGVTVFPNPAADELTIGMEVGVYRSFTIANGLGQQYMQQQLSGTQTKVDIRVLPAGVYYIMLKGEYGVRVEKFVK
jgi:hypothetical protein